MKRTIVFIITLLFALNFKTCNSYAEGLKRFGSDQEFYEYVVLMLGDETYLINKKGQYVNRNTFNDYQVIVYGSQHGDTKKGEATWVLPGFEHLIGKMLPRYIGYNYEGDDAGNVHFTPDVTSGRDPRDFNYVKVSGALESWRNVHPDVKEHMLNAPLYGNGAAPPFTTLKAIGGYEYGKCVAPATWLNPGAIYFNHRAN